MPSIARPRRPAATLGSLGVVLAVAVGLGLSACAGIGGRVVDSVGDHRFTRPLAIPPLAASKLDASGTRVFSLTAQEGSQRFAGGVASATRGYNGAYLGPTPRAHRGERVEVRARNRLRDVTTLHWHGMHLPPTADGGPHQPIRPGASRSPAWTVDLRPNATTRIIMHFADYTDPAHPYMYHCHLLRHEDSGMMGQFVVLRPGDREPTTIPTMNEDHHEH